MKYLFQVNLGPVQGFIAASRKTRDLTAGSDLLVELTKAVAGLMKDKGGNLIFPAKPELPAANIVLAEIDGDPAKVAQDCRDWVRGFLQDKWNDVASKQGFKFMKDNALAKAQIEAFPEVSCTWVPSGDDYAKAKETLDQLASSRKTLREFGPAPMGHGRHMGSLDPGYEQVYDDKARDPFGTRVKPNERLDAMGILKRFGTFSPDAKRYRMQSTRDVAMGHLLAKADAAHWDRAVREGIALADIVLGDFDEYGLDAGKVDELKSFKQQVWEKIGIKRTPDAPTYFAILLADGDNMGKALRALKTVEQHRKFSETLAVQFAQEAEELFKGSDKAGQLVYAGGDDVLALLPLEGAVELARRLHEMFAAAMEKAGAEGATLSVGLAVVHVQENLRSALEFARDLEKSAKKVKHIVWEEGKEVEKKKDALAVGVRPRSGGDVVVAMPWAQKPDELLNAAIAAFENRIAPHGFPYEVRELADELIRLQRLDKNLVDFKLIAAEYHRICDKKDSEKPDDLKGLLPEWVTDPKSLRTFADLLVAARSMKTKTKKEANV